MACGQKKILLDCSGLVTLDSQGLTALVESHLFLQGHGGQLKLVNLSPLLREVLELTGLLAVIPCFHDEETGLRSFSSP